MNNPAMLMFNQGSGTGKFNINNFIRINTFSKSESSTINNALNNSQLIFSPSGWLYSLSAGILTILFSNPLVYDMYQHSYSESYIVDPTKFSELTDQQNTKYYVSPPDVVNVNGGGWLLYQDSVNNYYILYNPFNRQNFNYNINDYQNYCNTINFSDPGCYCTNFPTQGQYPCVYDAAESKVAGQALLNALNSANISNLSSNTIEAINILKSNKSCGCLSNMCTNWQTTSTTLASKIPSMNQISTCAQDQVVNICASDIGGGQGVINTTSTINVTQNCPAQGPVTPPTLTPLTALTALTPLTPLTPPVSGVSAVSGGSKMAKSDSKKMLIIGGVVLLLVIIFLFIMFK